MSDVERLAAHCHNKQWSGWMKYLFGICAKNPDGTMTIPVWAVERWTRQANTLYAELPANEKESDREEAREILEVLEG